MIFIITFHEGKMQVFDMFDIKRNGVIDFGEFVRSLNVFHPNASKDMKTECMKFLYSSEKSIALSVM